MLELFSERNACFLFLQKKDAFVLCRIFQKSGLGPPNGDRYAPFVEEEWNDDAALFVPGGEAEEDTTTGDENRPERNEVVRVAYCLLVYFYVVTPCCYGTHQLWLLIYLNKGLGSPETNMFFGTTFLHLKLDSKTL